MITAIARHQIVALRRQRTFLTFLAVFLLMTALAGVIGWSGHQTIIRVYDQAVATLAADGQPAPPDPFLSVPPLSLLSNMTIYVPLIGALLAILLGHLSVAEDQASGIGRLVFSRPVARTTYFLGTCLGCATALAAILGLATITSTVSLVVANDAVPSVGTLARLVAFYGLSWLYLLFFALVGMVATLLSRRRSLGLLAGLSVWLVVTFVLPQFTSGLRPTASLNPVSDPVSNSLTFFQLTSRARPLSVSEMYKDASAQILGTAAGESVASTLGRVAPIAVLTLAVGIVAAMSVRKHDYSSVGAA
jgi:ABC-type transport system involved in multi-copper enzyme maturation permease subunit